MSPFFAHTRACLSMSKAFAVHLELFFSIFFALNFICQRKGEGRGGQGKLKSEQWRDNAHPKPSCPCAPVFELAKELGPWCPF